MMPRVIFRFFSLLKDAVGSKALVLDVEEGCSVRCVLEKLASENEKLAKALDAIEWNVLVLINGRPASLDDIPQGEVTVFPPSAGGSCRKCVGRVIEKGEEFDLNLVVRELSSVANDVGAIALFVGVVRGINMGEKVEVLEYEHDERTAPAKLREIAEYIADKYGVKGVFIGHFVGKLRPGDLTLIVGVAGGHRKDVYSALQEAVEKVKHEAPIWKKEYRETGKYYIIGDKVVKADEIEAKG